MIYNFAPSYREAIFKLIDQEYDCDWYFGNNETDIKGLDLSVLQRTQLLKNHVIFRYPLYYQKGVLSLLWKKEYTTYFMLGDLFCLSTWLMGLLAWLFYPKKRIYFWSHGWYGKEQGLKRWLKKIFFSLADGTFLYGNHAKNLMLKEGFSEDRLYVIRNSLAHEKQIIVRRKLCDTSVYRKHFTNGYNNLIFIGRLTQVKRLDLLIKALVKLRERDLFYNLTFIGDGAQKEMLQDLVKRNNIEENVWFYGACYDESTNAELIYNADLCVAPGNVGLTAMHVMVFGTPVATHDSFMLQMPEFEAIHDGTTGCFFKYEDVNSIADSIERWFRTHKNDREKIREACFREIDMNWTPRFQLEVIKKHLKVD